MLLAAAACAGSTPPSPSQLMGGARAGVSADQPCQLSGDLAVTTLSTETYTITTASLGPLSGGRIVRHVPGGKQPLTIVQDYVDTGTTIYYRSADEVRVADQGVPAGLTGKWFAMPSPTQLSTADYAQQSSRISTLPAAQGGVLLTAILQATQGLPALGDCQQLVRLFADEQPDTAAISDSTIGGSKVHTFQTSGHALGYQPYTVAVTADPPTRLVRLTSHDGRSVEVSYQPNRGSGLNPPPAADVLTVDQASAILTAAR
jgi:hypothetical protein